MNTNQLRNIGNSEVSKAWLRDIEHAVDEHLANRLSLHKVIELTEKSLSKLCPGYRFTVSTLDVEKPFIMSIYPDLNQLESKCGNLVNILNDVKKTSMEFIDEWNKITSWNIELDMKLFENKGLDLVSENALVKTIDHKSISYSEYDKEHRANVKKEFNRIKVRVEPILNKHKDSPIKMVNSTEINNILNINEKILRLSVLTGTGTNIEIPLVYWDLVNKNIGMYSKIYKELMDELEKYTGKTNMFKVVTRSSGVVGTIFLVYNKRIKLTSLLESHVPTNHSNYGVINGKEFVAMLMHEIGHVAHTNHRSLISNYRKNKAKFKMVEKLILSESYLLRKVFMPMMIHTLNFRVVSLGHVSHDLEEIKADLNIPNEYKSSLVEYLDRCILSNPDALNTIMMTKSEFDNDQQISVEFTRETLYLMKRRRNILNQYIQAQYKMSESNYIKAFTKRFATLFSGIKLEGREGEMDIIKEGSLSRQFEQEYSLYEMKANKILTEAQRVSDRDLSILQVESETIDTSEEKMYVLHTIYDYIEFIEVELRKRNKSITQEEINKDSRIIYLISLRNQLMKKEIVEKQYGVFVKYPEGYEG